MPDYYYWTFISLGLITLLYVVMTFNRLVRARNLVKEGWSNIDVQLKRRHTLIPNLIETVKSYTEFERSVLVEVTKTRNECVQLSDEGPSLPLMNHENQLSSHLAHFWGLVEQYPDLKAIQSFIQFQADLTDTEDKIQIARRYYNGAVRDMNILAESIPSNLVAKLFGFKSERFFQIENPMVRLAPKL